MADHNQLGVEGEAMACEHLLKNGYTILATNWRSGHAEIDIIAESENHLVFVEVKTRSTEIFGLPEESVNQEKQAYITKAAEDYLYKYPSKKEIRYDVISVVMPENTVPSVHHIRDAFFPRR